MKKVMGKLFIILFILGFFVTVSSFIFRDDQTGKTSYDPIGSAPPPNFEDVDIV